MEINSGKFIEIMSSNFDLEIVETDIGKGIKMNCFEAFIYSSITGSGYLDNYVYPFTPKGLMKLFYNAFDYKFVTGIFENTSLKNTPYLLSKAKPFLFNSDKIIIPVEFETEKELQIKLKQFLEKEKCPTNFIIQRIEASKKGNGMEPFMEYLACETFRKKGFAVENQIPLTHSQGSPDFGAYLVKSTYSKLHLIELALIRLGYNGLKDKNKKENYNIVGEAKTGTTILKKQLTKYMKTNIFDEGIAIHPSKVFDDLPWMGCLYLNRDFKISYLSPKEKSTFVDKKMKDNYSKWLKNYFKFFLIANFDNDELSNFYYINTGEKISTKKKLIEFIINLNEKDILKELERVIENG